VNPAEPPALAALRRHACLQCHSTDGTVMVGPTFRGLFGQTLEVIADGKPRRVLADEAHLRHSIRNPRAQRLKGYPDAMPAIDLEPAELDEIVTYIKSLK
jgi:cytochrome c oxidase subunit 2